MKIQPTLDPHSEEYLHLIPPDTPYSIVICEYIFPNQYRVEGLASNADDTDIFYIGTLAECDVHFERLKGVLIEAGNYVREVGCGHSRIRKPRHMFINHSPYDVWKILYLNFKLQATVREADAVIAAYHRRLGITHPTEFTRLS